MKRNAILMLILALCWIAPAMAEGPMCARDGKGCCGKVAAAQPDQSKGAHDHGAAAKPTCCEGKEGKTGECCKDGKMDCCKDGKGCCSAAKNGAKANQNTRGECCGGKAGAACCAKKAA